MRTRNVLRLILHINLNCALQSCSVIGWKISRSSEFLSYRLSVWILYLLRESTFVCKEKVFDCIVFRPFYAPAFSQDILQNILYLVLSKLKKYLEKLWRLKMKMPCPFRNYDIPKNWSHILKNYGAWNWNGKCPAPLENMMSLKIEEIFWKLWRLKMKMPCPFRNYDIPIMYL